MLAVRVANHLSGRAGPVQAYLSEKGRAATVTEEWVGIANPPGQPSGQPEHACQAFGRHQYHAMLAMRRGEDLTAFFSPEALVIGGRVLFSKEIDVNAA